MHDFIHTMHDRCLQGARLCGADMRRCNLYQANLSGANLSGARLDESNLSLAQLCGANLCGASLVGADLSDCVASADIYGTAALPLSRSRASQHAIDTMVYTAHVKKHGKHGW